MINNLKMDSPPKEIELKLELIGEINAEKVSNTLGDALCRPVVQKTVDNTYFDTRSLRLRDRKLALRVRNIEGSFTQTLKLGGGSGALQKRGEWECPLETPQPDLDRIDDSVVKEHIGLLFGDPLKEVFQTRFSRHVFDVAWPPTRVASSRIEIAFDKGEVAAAGRQSPISEIELELKEGSVQHLFELAAFLAERLPVRPASGSKAATGYRLFANQPPPPVRADPPELEKDMSVQDALQLMLSEATAQWIANIAPALDGHDPEGVHQLRVALRRLRSLISLFRAYFTPTGSSSWQAILRDNLKKLGPARQLDVLIDDTIAPLCALLPGETSLRIADNLARHARSKAYDGVRAALNDPVEARRMVDFLAWIERGEWRGEVPADMPARLGEAAVQILDVRYRKVMKRGKGFADMPMDQRHELRLVLKKLRYAVDFLGPMFEESYALKKALRRLQDELGMANDLAECRSLLAALQSHIGSGAKGRDERTALAHVDGIAAGWGLGCIANQEAGSAKAWARFAKAEKFWERRS